MIVDNNNTKQEFLVDENSSLNKFRWRLFNQDERFVNTLSQKYEIPDIIAKIICARNVRLDDVEN